MATLDLPDRDLNRTRFALSPLWETAGSLWVLDAPEKYPLHRPWVRLVQGAWEHGDFPYLRTLMRKVRYVPDFLTPPPATSRPEFEQELEVVRRTPPAVVRAELERYARLHGLERDPLILAAIERPEAALAAIVEELRAYWALAVAPFWPQVRAVLEGDMLTRGRALATEGPQAVLGQLHDQLRYENGVLHIKPNTLAGAERSDGRGVLLLPSVFVNGLCVVLGGDWQPTVSYGARGLGTFWEASAPSHGSALAGLIGAGRAAVLESARLPVPNAEIARRLGITPAAVSQHMAALRGADLVEPHRVGRFVYFVLTPRGEALLNLFDGTRHPAALTLDADVAGLAG